MNFLDSARIICEQCGDGVVVLSWQVSAELTQIHGFLHGGISAAIAEHAASLGANEGLKEGERALGLSVESHHLKAVSETSECKTLAWLESGGSTIQVWRVEQYAEAPQPAADTRIDAHSEAEQPEPLLFNTSHVTLYIQQPRQ